MQTRTLDDSSRASLMADVRLSTQRLTELEPRLRGWRGKLFDWRLSLGHRQRLSAHEVFAEHLHHGDAAGAVVMSVDPVRIAAYANELDAVVMLAFDDEVARRFDLEPGARLIAVSTYAPMEMVEHGWAPDIIPGPRASGRFADAAPLIAEFLSDDRHKLDLYRRFQILQEEWEHIAALGREHRERFGDRARDGAPIAICFE